MPAMLRTGMPRRLIALVAAYGLVLQAMLSAVAAVAPAFDQVICAAGTDPRGEIGKHTSELQSLV